MTRHLVVFALRLVALASVALSQPAAGPAWTATTSDFSSISGTLESVGETGVTLRTAGGELRELPLDALARLENAASTATPAKRPPFVLHLRNGDRLGGSVVGLDDVAMTMQLADFGPVRVPLAALMAVEWGEVATGRPWRTPAPPADEVVLANGDRLTGFLSKIEEQRWTLSADDGTETPIDAAAVRGVRIADSGLPAPASAARFRAGLADGSVLGLDDLRLVGGRFSLAYLGARATMEATGLVWIEPVGGPVTWLGDLAPVEQSHVPYLGEAAGAPIEGLPTGRGFAVRSRSQLTFDVPAGSSQFRVQYRVPPANALADVDVRILLDGKVAHERAGLRPCDAPDPVLLDLNGATSLTLEVDYGKGLDVQDELHWIDPALLRGGTATRPATQQAPR